MRRLLLVSGLFSLTLGCDAITGGSDVAPAPKPGGGRTVIPAPGGGGSDDEGEAGDGAITDDDCDKVEPEPLPEGKWVSGTLHCGDQIVSHTGGTGRALFDTRFYEKHFCTPATTHHDGANERVFTLKVPEGDKSVFVSMDSPCADLDLFAFKYSGSNPPTVSSNIGQCEANIKGGTKSEKVRLTTQKATTWVIAVEGKGQENGPFSLTVKCKDGLY